MIQAVVCLQYVRFAFKASQKEVQTTQARPMAGYLGGMQPALAGASQG